VSPPMITRFRFAFDGIIREVGDLEVFLKRQQCLDLRYCRLQSLSFGLSTLVTSGFVA
jgi:hypothetical protein